MRNPNRNLNRELLDAATIHKARMRGHGKPIYEHRTLPGFRVQKIIVFNREPIPEPPIHRSVPAVLTPSPAHPLTPSS